MAKKKPTDQDAKRISGAKGLRRLVSDLEDVITPAIVDEIATSSELGSVLTGDYNISDKKTKITTVIFYSLKKDKAPREQSIEGFLRLIEDYMLEVSNDNFIIDAEWTTTTEYSTGVVKVFIKDKDKDGNPGTLKHTIQYTIKPVAGAKASLYEVAAQECLQAVGCAYLQAKGGKINIRDFIGFLNYAHDKAEGKATTKKNDDKWKTALTSVENHTDFGTTINNQRKDVYAFGIGDIDWVQSTVSSARALYSEMKDGTYIFYYPAAKKMEWWKKAYDDAKKQVLNNQPVFGNEIKAGMFDINKWNPADIFACKKGFNKPTFPKLTNNAVNETNKISESSLSYNMKLFNNSGGKSSKIDIGDAIKEAGKKASTVQGLPSLNQWLLNQVNEGNLYPISLKKAGKSARVKVINDTETKVSFEATLTSVEWKDGATKATNKVEVHFIIDVDGKERDYYINARQFNAGSDIKLQIEKTGALAFHGKVGLSIASFIIEKTDHNVKSSLNKIRNNKKYTDNKKWELNNSTKLFSQVGDIQETWKNTHTSEGKSQVLLNYVGELSNKGVTKIKNNRDGYVSKVQATEFGYIINHAKSNDVASKILYSLFTFAGSRGLVLYDGEAYKNHFASSVHLKVQ